MSLKNKLLKLLGSKPAEQMVGIDIGTSKIKTMVVVETPEGYKLQSIGIAPTPANCIQNNAITNPEKVGQAIRAMLDASEINCELATVAIPGPAVFTKKVVLNYSSASEVQENIMFEAGNYIPHSVANVHLDYQILGPSGNGVEVLLVAVKNEIIDSYSKAIAHAGLTPAIGDVDYFALENMFELSYPERAKSCIALMDIGARYTSVCIMQDGRSIFNGDVSVGGRLYTDSLCETLGLEPAAAEDAKMGKLPDGYDEALVSETISKTTEHIASELHRQLGFFWNAASTSRPIEAIFVCGGACAGSGLLDTLSQLTGLECEQMDPFRKLDCSGNFDPSYLSEIRSSMGIITGLAVRKFSDKQSVI